MNHQISLSEGKCTAVMPQLTYFNWTQFSSWTLSDSKVITSLGLCHFLWFLHNSLISGDTDFPLGLTQPAKPHHRSACHSLAEHTLTMFTRPSATFAVQCLTIKFLGKKHKPSLTQSSHQNIKSLHRCHLQCPKLSSALNMLPSEESDVVPHPRLAVAQHRCRCTVHPCSNDFSSAD